MPLFLFLAWATSAAPIENAPVPAFPIIDTIAIVQNGTVNSIGTVDSATVTKKIEAAESGYLACTNAEEREIALAIQRRVSSRGQNHEDRTNNPSSCKKTS